MKNLRKKLSLLGLALLLCTLLIPAGTALAAGNDVYFSTPYITTPGDNDTKGYVDPGQTFYVDIMFDSSTPTRGGGAGFDFNPSLVQVLGITEGDYYSGAGLATYFSPGTIDNVAGTVRNASGAATNNYPTGATGIGVFATVQMQALTGVSGTSALTFTAFPQTGFGDIDATELYPTLTNGSVQVGESTGPVAIDLKVTGSAGDIIDVTGYSVPDTTVTEDGFTIDAQTAMGALVHYCQANTIDIDIIDPWGYGAFVNQIGNDASDEGMWSYAWNETVPMVGAAAQPLTTGNSVHWFNSLLGYYSFALAVSSGNISLNEDITFTVTYTDGIGVTAGVDGAEVFISDTMGAWEPEPGTSYGYTNASGQLTIAWSELGTFYPYAESGILSSKSQYPAPQFICTSSTAGSGDTTLHGTTVAQLELTVPNNVLSGWLLKIGCINETDGTLTVKSNAPWEVTVEDSREDGSGSVGYMTQYDEATPAYGTLSLEDPFIIEGDGNSVDLISGVPVKIADGVPADQQDGNLGEVIDITFQQSVEYDDPILASPYDVYRIVITFMATQTF